MKNLLKKVSRVIVRIAIFIYCKIVYRVKIVGTENIPKDGPLIYCGNHRSYLDPPLIVVTAKRHVHFIAKEELRKVPLFAFLGMVFEGIYVKRDAKDIAAIKTALKYLKNNQCIALFPEGTRNGIEKGENVKGGVAFFALNSDAKVVPVGIKGGLKPFEKVTITYGKPMNFDKYKENKKDKEVMDKITKEIMDEIIRLTK